jgi:hypothetical protein
VGGPVDGGGDLAGIRCERTGSEAAAVSATSLVVLEADHRGWRGRRR